MKTTTVLILLLASLSAPAAAGLGHAFRNETSAGLRCRLSSETRKTAMTIQIEPMKLVSVAGQYRDIRCDEPVLRQRWQLADGATYSFRRNRDGSTISLFPQ